MDRYLLEMASQCFSILQQIGEQQNIFSLCLIFQISVKKLDECFCKDSSVSIFLSQTVISPYPKAILVNSVELGRQQSVETGKSFCYLVELLLNLMSSLSSAVLSPGQVFNFPHTNEPIGQQTRTVDSCSRYNENKFSNNLGF